MEKVSQSSVFKYRGQSIMKEIHTIPLSKIVVGEHEQRLAYDDEDIEGLAASIKRLGLMYPIVVEIHKDGFKVVEGHRRRLAVTKLGWTEVECFIADYGGVDNVEIAFAGNFFRKELSPIELAGAIADAHKDGGLSIEQLSAGFHKTENWVRRMIAVMTWPGDVQQAVHAKLMSLSAAANLALIEDPVYREFLLGNAVDGGCTARTTASWLQAWRLMKPATEASTSEPVEGTRQQAPAVPQAPCFCCAQLFTVDMVSHVPVCGACIQIIRKVSEV